ncbi:MAG: hypothetical protein ACE5GD_08350 [Candidatus Geothermarchaeales archaeon]
MSDKLIGMLREQTRLEQEIARALSPLADTTKNSVFKMFLRRLALDSMRHSDMLQAVIDLHTGAVVSDIDKKTMAKELDGHIRNEGEMLNRIQIIMSEVEDEKTRSLLKDMILEEKRHHQILNGLLKIIERVESISDEDWWDIVYDRSEWLF